MLKIQDREDGPWIVSDSFAEALAEWCRRNGIRTSESVSLASLINEITAPFSKVAAKAGCFFWVEAPFDLWWRIA